MSKKNKFLIIVLVIFFIVLVLIYYLFFTTSGSSLIAKFTLAKYFDSEKINIDKIDGNLYEKLSFQDIEIRDLAGLPKDAVLKIQKLDIQINSFAPDGFTLDIFNGRLFLSSSETIVFSGSYQYSDLDLNVYSKLINARDILDLFAKSTLLRDIGGYITDLDVDIRGSFLQPEIKGNLYIKKLTHNGFIATDCPLALSLNLKDIKDNIKIIGQLNLEKGQIASRNTIVQLEQSKIMFSEDPMKPIFDIKGFSNIEKTAITIVLKGTIDEPELRLKSKPSLPEGQLLVMLATGKSWKGVETSFNKGQVSPDIAADFIDFFVFGGAGSKMAKQFGITDISIKFDKDSKGVAVKKDITHKAEVSYGVEQKIQTNANESTATQKVGAGYKITDSISIEGEKELVKKEETQVQSGQIANDKVLLKYKTQF